MKPSSADTRTMSLGDDTANITVPKWLVIIYAVAGVTLLPWTIYISASLPVRHVSRHWDLIWGGFDVYVTILLLMSAYFIARKSLWVTLTSSALAASLAIDGWFDILSARAGRNQFHAFLLGILIEFPIAILSLYVAIHAAKQNIHHTQQNR